jgi:hypothetical protein
LPGVFISYRHQDRTAGWATAILVHLKAVCGLDAFKDVDSLPPGTDWRAQIRAALEDCDVALVLIGPDWLTLADDHGRRRLDDPDDVLCFEIKQVLDRDDARVIPMVFDEVKMPSAAELPQSIRELAARQIYRWHSDQPSDFQLERLAEAVSRDRCDPVPRGPESGLSARVLELCDALQQQISDRVALAGVEKIQAALRKPIDDPRGIRSVLGDASRAASALASLDELSTRTPSTRFIRDRAQELLDSGPQMQLIEVAKWYERCLSGEVELCRDELDEIERLLTGRSPSERLGLAAGTDDRDLRDVVADRINAWTALENSAQSPPATQRLARAVEAFYERLDQRLGAQAELGGSIVNA